ncbi:hypothetical protein KP509_05G033400 [Ceratopteris richardii]|uniref:Bifunctional inhibitor/plant lipid transfer protein/seed storage helical domain-containing protein n=1 Tax=Ceratopteris richardii TaxID=49495 RepID=A0A8T2USH3_CERRI|nr:hypothetical protein KP509_05G033400 [Ceratopteris richardii]
MIHPSKVIAGWICLLEHLALPRSTFGTSIRMRFVTQTSVSVLLALCLVLLQRATMALPTQECSNSVDAAVTPCEADAKSPECCTAFGAIFSTYPTCLCDVIAEVFASDPNYQLNGTKLREIIV